MKRKLTLLMLGLLCLSCNDMNKNEQIETKTMKVYTEIEDFDNDKSIVDIFEDFQLIPLENTREAMISDVRRLVVTQEYLYIYDNNGIPAIHVFRKDGIYSHHIGCYGKGKSEYVRVFDMDVERDGDKILILTTNAVKIYSKQDGSFLYSVNLTGDVRLQNILCTENNYILSSNHVGAEQMICIYDKNFNLEQKLLQQSKDIANSVSPIYNPLQCYQDTICYLDFYDSSFYLWRESDVLNIKKYKLESSDMLSVLDQKKGSGIEDQIEDACYAENKIVGSMVYQQFLCYYIFDLAKEVFEMYICSDFAHRIYAYFDGYYYTVVSPEILYNIIKKNSQYSTEVTERFRSLIEESGQDLNENGNYWILKMKLKH